MRIALLDTASGPRLAAECDGAYLPMAGNDLRAMLTADADLTDPVLGSPPVTGSLRAPLRPGKIVAIGLNYLDHIRETGLDKPVEPLIFTKFVSSVVGPTDDIVVDPALTERVDWEVELAAVIGRRARNVDVTQALSHVAGYLVANDISARDLQFRDGQWVRGKSLDTFCPLGPVFVTADEIPDPQRLSLRTIVNGEIVQDSSTEEMIFSVAELVAFCSRSFTLDPGDVILTGTPWGCGEFMNPKRSLREGDVVEVSVDGIGRLRNTVRHASWSLSRRTEPCE
ncbi:5-carboxymethyl-2-hydroxymuconate isomerase [Actinoplanes sp. SE50]|uniref:fumarylacetoacetate hydrolase family protein n=1 Tax=unclassified Actinoplanes TaxID=2626549 RepID=UPI00023EBBB7|nr:MULTISPECIES: fumarylacetoacetate hydrolase family protein [unclassified Actinoplanes]AEV85060.1 5-carboxymethyl-2-hydroxymuconateDelta- isomerase [Actinoplanes sp. SE50/110]ATO83451.1 5-carboxymethyl-2-hydroxymuconate isomerase [Actinoplanes sp. SE50]SLM00858.1 Ureidoglycolate lyase [Actinoplanes sp. SE50/110]